MAARTAKKVTSGRKAPARKAAAPKSAPKRGAAAKRASAKKASAKPAAKRAARAKAPLAKPAKPAIQAAPPRPAKPKGHGSVTAEQVNLGHVFTLRPRVNTGFNPIAFRDAVRALADERYATLEEAARAVAEKAIEIASGGPGKDPFQRR